MPNTNKIGSVKRRGKVIDRWNTAAGPRLVSRKNSADPFMASTKSYFRKHKLGRGNRKPGTPYFTGGGF